MKTDRNAALPKATKPAKSLTQVLGQNEHVEDLVEECAEELSSVSTGLKQEVAEQDSTPGVEDALEKSEAAENKAQDAAAQLSVVNRALVEEVSERTRLDRQLTAVKEKEEAARHAALHDPLTGLPNRVLFIDRLEHGLAQAKRHSRGLAVMFVDLDGFKAINDTHGHEAGDIVLRTVAQRLKENTRGDDTVSRHGGDEFLYLVTEVRDDHDITLIAEKVVHALQAPCDISMRDLTVSPNIKGSIGIAIFPKDGTTADELIKSADTAMYRAKRSKSRYAFAEQ